MSTEPEFLKVDDEPVESHAEDPTLPPPIKKAESLSKRPPSGELVEEVLAMFAHSGPMRDPLLEKIGPAQINRTLEIRAKHEEFSHELRMARQRFEDKLSTKCLVFLGFSLLIVLALCLLFLHYGKTDQVFNLITLLFAGGGGVGIGYGMRRRTSPMPEGGSMGLDDSAS